MGFGEKIEPIVTFRGNTGTVDSGSIQTLLVS